MFIAYSEHRRPKRALTKNYGEHRIPKSAVFFFFLIEKGASKRISLRRIAKSSFISTTANRKIGKGSSKRKNAYYDVRRFRKKLLRFFFAFGEKCCAPKVACCAARDQPRGSCCAKRLRILTLECCARASAQQLINALWCILLQQHKKVSQLIAATLCQILTQE